MKSNLRSPSGNGGESIVAQFEQVANRFQQSFAVSLGGIVTDRRQRRVQQFIDQAIERFFDLFLYRRIELVELEFIPQSFEFVEL